MRRSGMALLVAALAVSGCTRVAASRCSEQEPRTACAEARKNCGPLSVPLRCSPGSRFVDCGSCAPPDHCGGGGEPGVCACVPESDAALCLAKGANCGTASSTDSCGATRTLDCGTCFAPETCGGAGVDNACACPPQPEAELCRDFPATCGRIDTLDMCGSPRTVDCGSCTLPETCGALEPHACGCRPETDGELCSAHGLSCGHLETVDGCGAPRSLGCGECAWPATCGGAGVRGACGVSEARECTNAWNWYSPELPPSRFVPSNPAWGASPEDVWVGTDSGLYHWNGVGWTRSGIAGAVNCRVRSISGTSSSDIWAAALLGDDLRNWEAALHFDGVQWNVLSVPNSTVTIAAFSPTSVWTNGADGVHRYDGTVWTLERAADPVDVGWGGEIFGSSPTDIWFGGRGHAVHWDGTRFEDFPLQCGSSPSIRPGWSSGPTDAWVSCGDSLFQFDGARWKTISTQIYLPTDVYGFGPADVYVSRPFMHWDGLSWTQLSNWPLPRPLSPRFARVAGGTLFAIDLPLASPGAFLSPIFRLDATGWTPLVHGLTNSDFVDVSVTGRDDAWACARQEPPWHYDGSAWARKPATWPECQKVWATDANDVWFVGTSLSHFDGTGLATPSIGAAPGAKINAVWASSAADVWAVGQSQQDYQNAQAVLAHWNGSVWTQYPVAGVNSVDFVRGAGWNDVWAVGRRTTAVGDDGAFLHWTGSAWTASFRSTMTVSALGVTPGGEAFVSMQATYNGTMHWDGVQWRDVMASAHPSGYCADGGAAWAVDYDLIRWTGSNSPTWSHSGLGESTTLLACSMKSGYGWTVGSGGALARICP